MIVTAAPQVSTVMCVPSLAWELPCAMGTAQKTPKIQKQKTGCFQCKYWETSLDSKDLVGKLDLLPLTVGTVTSHFGSESVSLCNGGGNTY